MWQKWYADVPITRTRTVREIFERKVALDVQRTRFLVEEAILTFSNLFSFQLPTTAATWSGLRAAKGPCTLRTLTPRGRVWLSPTSSLRYALPTPSVWGVDLVHYSSHILLLHIHVTFSTWVYEHCTFSKEFQCPCKSCETVHDVFHKFQKCSAFWTTRWVDEDFRKIAKFPYCMHFNQHCLKTSYFLCFSWAQR